MATRRCPEDYATLALWAAAAQTGDTMSLARGTRYLAAQATGLFALTSVNNLTFTTHGTGDDPVIGGQTELNGAGWTRGGVTTKYTRTLATGLTITAVSCGYESALFRKVGTPCEGARLCWLTEASSAAGVTDGSDTWFYDSGTGLLTVSINAWLALGLSMGDGTIAYDLGSSAYNFFEFTTCSGITFEGNYVFERPAVRYVTTSDGAAIQFIGGSDNLVKSCTFRYTNDKAVAFVSCPTGRVIGNSFEGITAHTPDSMVVWYSNDATDITGGFAVSNNFKACGMYTMVGGVLAPRPGWASSSYGGATLNCLSAHTGSTGTIDDVEWRGNTFDIDPQFFMGTATAAYPAMAQPMSANGCGPLTGSGYDLASYPVRVIGNTLTGGMGQYWPGSSNIGYARNRFRHNAGKVNNQYRSAAGSFGTFAFGTAATNSTIGDFGNDWETNNIAASSNATACWSFGNNNSATANLQVYSVKSTTRDTALHNDGVVSTNQTHIFVAPLNAAAPGNSRMRFHKHAFIGTSNAAAGDMAAYARRFLLHNDWYTAASPGATELRQAFIFDECLYFGMPTTGTANGGFTGSAAGPAPLNDAAEWTAAGGMDPRGVTGTAPTLTSAQTSGEPALGSNLLTARSAAFETTLGINDKMGSNIGAYGNGLVSDELAAMIGRVSVIPLD